MFPDGRERLCASPGARSSPLNRDETVFTRFDALIKSPLPRSVWLRRPGEFLLRGSRDGLVDLMEPKPIRDGTSFASGIAHLVFASMRDVSGRLSALDGTGDLPRETVQRSGTAERLCLSFLVECRTDTSATPCNPLTADFLTEGISCEDIDNVANEGNGAACVAFGELCES